MKIVTSIVTTLVASAILTSTVCGQSFEAGGFGGALRMGGGGDIGSVDITNPSDPASKVNLTNKWLFGARMGINTGDHLGYEIAYAYQRTGLKIGGDSASQGFGIHTVTGGVLFHLLGQDSRIRPFIQGGGGFSNFFPPGTSLSQGGGDRKWGFMYGAGVKIKTSEHTLIRFDYREHQTGKPFNLAGQDGLLRRTEFSAGLSYTL
jgi:opacity protein-like surface antigen